MAARELDVGEPAFRLEDYFVGRCKAWGMFQDRFGRVRRQFKVDAEGRWDGEVLTLVENFTYDDGETDQRTWLIKKTGEQKYRGEANDIIGHAEGEVRDDALGWRYDFALPIGQKTWVVRLEDWMHLQGDGVLICRSKVSKLGLRLGEVTMVFQKEAQSQQVESRIRVAAR